MQIEEDFRRAWKSSPAAQLLVPDPTSILSLGKENGRLASIAYVAFKRGRLPILDNLVQKFEIPTRGNKSFKGRLSENWLLLPPEERRSGSNQTKAALAELAVAECLKGLGYKIINLDAWDSKSCDIEAVHDKNKYVIEVKYVPDSPEWFSSRVNAAKGEDASKWFSSDSASLNYFFLRIAEAIMQLERCDEGKKCVCLVFDQSAYDEEELLRENIESFEKWSVDPHGEHEGFPTSMPMDQKRKVLSKQPLEWLRNPSIVFIGIMESWNCKFSKILKNN